jgi:hypothetical protein
MENSPARTLGMKKEDGICWYYTPKERIDHRRADLPAHRASSLPSSLLDAAAVQVATTDVTLGRVAKTDSMRGCCHN